MINALLGLFTEIVSGWGKCSRAAGEEGLTHGDCYLVPTCEAVLYFDMLTHTRMASESHVRGNPISCIHVCIWVPRNHHHTPPLVRSGAAGVPHRKALGTRGSGLRVGCSGSKLPMRSGQFGGNIRGTGELLGGAEHRDARSRSCSLTPPSSFLAWYLSRTLSDRVAGIAWLRGGNIECEKVYAETRGTLTLRLMLCPV